MCGICGFISEKEITTENLKNMNNTINYRGPDSEGIYFEETDGKKIGLAHKRLAIMDLSPLGHQPMFSEDKNIIVIFNGEIYNFQEIKEDLEKKGYKFRSTSDTEVIVKGYEEYGIEIIEKLNGMFAIALYDKKDKELFLIRDRIGIKPLYFHIDEKDIIFASELKPILEYPYFKREIDKDSLSDFLHHSYISGEKSIFKNTFKLLPGSYLRYKNEKITIENYWSIKKEFLNKKIDEKLTEEQWKSKIKDFLEKSIKDRMISDVPLGAFLSGGIDSSLIVSIMQKISSKPIKTFTIGFEEKEYNEAENAKKIANYLKTDHTEYYMKIEELKKYIDKLAVYYDEPFADSSQLPTMLVSEIAKQKVTVALSGDGGDELFCGYSRYESLFKMQKLKNISKIINLIPFRDEIIKNIGNRYLRGFYFKNDSEIVNSEYLFYSHNKSIIKDYNHKINERYFENIEISKNIQEKSMLKDMITYLPDDIMTKVDRASMAFSLETRAPFLDDHKFIELSFKIPHRYKYKNNEKKYILKEVLKEYIPENLIENKKKGFAVPIFKWLREDLKYLIDNYLSKEEIEKQQIFNSSDIEIIKRIFLEKTDGEIKVYKGLDIDKTMWNLIMFQMWYQKYMN
ncbi:asparagine synthase (glutamine-hydrolyzing) [Fusobacterium varium]|uniref:asparagine synthase (glutamine-hydrolyzing) n=1 Tax=Fusobacterium varium TaxID=856 RepID=UPI002FF00271